MVNDPSKRRRIWCPLVESRSGGMYTHVHACTCVCRRLERADTVYRWLTKGPPPLSAFAIYHPPPAICIPHLQPTRKLGRPNEAETRAKTKSPPPRTADTLRRYLISPTPGRDPFPSPSSFAVLIFSLLIYAIVCFSSATTTNILVLPVSSLLVAISITISFLPTQAIDRFALPSLDDRQSFVILSVIAIKASITPVVFVVYLSSITSIHPSVGIVSLSSPCYHRIHDIVHLEGPHCTTHHKRTFACSRTVPLLPGTLSRLPPLLSLPFHSGTLWLVFSCLLYSPGLRHVRQESASSKK